LTATLALSLHPTAALCALAAVLALPAGYWLGWALDPRRVVWMGASLLLKVWLAHRQIERLQGDVLDALFVLTYPEPTR
jgi:FtsH-binding integral membrane protein